MHSRTTFKHDKSIFAQVGQFRANFQKIQIPRNLNASINIDQIQYERSFIDVLYLCAVLGRSLWFYKSKSYYSRLLKNLNSHKILNRRSIFMKIVINKGTWLPHGCTKFQLDIASRLWVIVFWKVENRARARAHTHTHTPPDAS